jgi:hypothetical protein
MDDQDLVKASRARLWKFWSAVVISVIGAAAMVAGFLLAGDRSGDAATGPGVLAGIGFSCMLVGAFIAWRTRPGDKRWMTEAPRTRRDRLQAQRSAQLFMFPAVAVIFLALALNPVRDVSAGEGQLRDYLAILLPVLYAWGTVSIAMGWDHNSRQNRRVLEDELTIAIRARAMTAAFLVLMIGATAALALFLVRPELGAIGLMIAIAAGGATAGVRFAWLDREAGQDG